MGYRQNASDGTQTCCFISQVFNKEKGYKIKKASEVIDQYKDPSTCTLLLDLLVAMEASHFALQGSICALNAAEGSTHLCT